jgi:hypothetical protein
LAQHKLIHKKLRTRMKLKADQSQCEKNDLVENAGLDVGVGEAREVDRVERLQVV